MMILKRINKTVKYDQLRQYFHEKNLQAKQQIHLQYTSLKNNTHTQTKDIENPLSEQ